MSHRREKVASTLQRIIQNILVRGLNDPRIRGLITVTEVEISSDLRHAAVHVSILPEERESAALHGLRDATMKVQRLVNEESSMRRPPRIEFRLDRRLKKQAEILGAIREAVGEGNDQEDLRREFGEDERDPDV